MSKYKKYTVYFSTGLFLLLFFGQIGKAAPTIDGKGPKLFWENLVGHLGDCNKPAMLDLYSIWGVGISPSNGYWGDKNGVPRKGGNIVNGADYLTNNDVTEVIDTFYFFITSPSIDYCGLKQGDYLAMEVIFNGTCHTDVEGDVVFDFAFCYGVNLDRIHNKVIDPMNLNNLILSDTKDPYDKLLDGDGEWKVNILAYKDSSATPTRMTSDELNAMLDLKKEGNGATIKDTFYVQYVSKATGLATSGLQRVTISIYPEPKLTINSDPDLTDQFREYGVDDVVTITANNGADFDSIRFYLNNKYLNKYFLGDNTSTNEIKLSALVFTGAEDIIRVEAWTNTHKCFVTDQVNAVVNVPLPNVFTPDGDGVNDIFLGGDKFADREFHLEVFNRWGNRLYSGSNGWDGTYNGAEVPPGTYYYALQLKSPDGTTKTFKGTVTLVRNRR